MIKNVLQEVGGIGVYALVSLLLFFIVFTGALVFTFIQRASLCRKMESLPLQDDEVTPQTKKGGK
jgi:cytochrome c oxidase cbb3-type subunit 3